MLRNSAFEPCLAINMVTAFDYTIAMIYSLSFSSSNLMLYNNRIFRQLTCCMAFLLRSHDAGATGDAEASDGCPFFPPNVFMQV